MKRAAKSHKMREEKAGGQKGKGDSKGSLGQFWFFLIWSKNKRLRAVLSKLSQKSAVLPEKVKFKLCKELGSK